MEPNTRNKLKLTTELKTLQAAIRSVGKRKGEDSELYLMLLQFMIELENERIDAMRAHMQTIRSASEDALGDRRAPGGESKP